MAKKFSLKKFVMELSAKYQNVFKTRHVAKQIKTSEQCFENTGDGKHSPVVRVFCISLVLSNACPNGFFTL